MEKKKLPKTPLIILIATLIFVISTEIVSAIPFIVGRVENAYDGESANGKTIMLWNPSEGQEDNLTDIIGITGNSSADNIYLMDCALLDNNCSIGTEIRVKVLDEGNNYLSKTQNATISGDGFQVIENITLNSPPVFLNLTVDDTTSTPIGEIDLIAGSTQTVTCKGVLVDYDGEDEILNLTTQFFDNTTSSYGAADDNNGHYTNTTCQIDTAYGNSNETYFTCDHEVQYYANSTDWNCTALAYDELNTTRLGSNTTFINPLLAIELPGIMDYGTVQVEKVTNQTTINVTNMGNVRINISLEGYALERYDNLSMNCSGGINISVGHQKYNLTKSNTSELNLAEFQNQYLNLTSIPAIRAYNLLSRFDDLTPNKEETNQTYWRIYIPPEVQGDCRGNVVFGARIGPES